jgi:hypothetical protein
MDLILRYIISRPRGTRPTTVRNEKIFVCDTRGLAHILSRKAVRQHLTSCVSSVYLLSVRPSLIACTIRFRQHRNGLLYQG